MRLLFVSHSFPPPGRPLANVGGMQRVATELYDALAALSGVEVEGLLMRSTWRATHARAPFFIARVLARLRSEARRPTVDAILFSSMVTGPVAVGARRLRAVGVRTGAIAHGRDVTLPSAVYQRLVPHAFAALDVILPVSRATGDECLARGLDPERMCVVPNGIDVTRFDAPCDRSAARAELLDTFGAALPPDALLLTSLGRHVPRKGFPWFAAEVMSRLDARVHWWLGGDGPETDAVRAAVAAHGLEGRVRLLGRLSDADLARLYRGADVFVMPNRPVDNDMEGFGVVMLEAGLAGLPTVGADLEGIADVIEEGTNGLLVPTGDAAAFAAAITRFADDRAALAALSARTPGYVRETFAWSTIAQQYADALADASVLA